MSCAPLPESVMMGSGQPSEKRSLRILRALASADSCSALVLETPEARLGSQSIRSQRRARTSESAVVGSLRTGRIRFQARASNSGLTGLTVA